MHLAYKFLVGRLGRDWFNLLKLDNEYHPEAKSEQLRLKRKKTKIARTHAIRWWKAKSKLNKDYRSANRNRADKIEWIKKVAWLIPPMMHTRK